MGTETWAYSGCNFLMNLVISQRESTQPQEAESAMNILIVDDSPLFVSRLKAF